MGSVGDTTTSSRRVYAQPPAGTKSLGSAGDSVARSFGQCKPFSTKQLGQVCWSAVLSGSSTTLCAIVFITNDNINLAATFLTALIANAVALVEPRRLGIARRGNREGFEETVNAAKSRSVEPWPRHTFADAGMPAPNSSKPLPQCERKGRADVLWSVHLLGLRRCQGL